MGCVWFALCRSLGATLALSGVSVIATFRRVSADQYNPVAEKSRNRAAHATPRLMKIRGLRAAWGLHSCNVGYTTSRLCNPFWAVFGRLRGGTHPLCNPLCNPYAPPPWCPDRTQGRSVCSAKEREGRELARPGEGRRCFRRWLAARRGPQTAPRSTARTGWQRKADHGSIRWVLCERAPSQVGNGALTGRGSALRRRRQRIRSSSRQPRG